MVRNSMCRNTRHAPPGVFPAKEFVVGGWVVVFFFFFFFFLQRSLAKISRHPMRIIDYTYATRILRRWSFFDMRATNCIRTVTAVYG